MSSAQPGAGRGLPRRMRSRAPSALDTLGRSGRTLASRGTTRCRAVGSTTPGCRCLASKRIGTSSTQPLCCTSPGAGSL
eukprot:2826072-Alexandrium_andersonii.AAC.1